MVNETCCLRWRLAVRAVLVNEIEMENHQVYGVSQVFKLLAVTER